MTARPPHTPPKEWIDADSNKPLWPCSVSGYKSWRSCSVDYIRDALDKRVRRHQAAVAREEPLTSSRDDKGTFNAV